ncbi:putative methyltransferase SirN-like protein [Lophiotrema nucula]|uniref:Putative methyltransferase SirN-like protein n=1 Tax=Lophiotrema nucula TaxID=690887 RepID=A0A6A5Z864_9PLEO|nr:putative methyltransferase SirN-like protein [Lophiotrema nucula]
METTEAAIYRLTNQHEAITESAGKLVFAPVNFSKPGLRVLDSATADGKWLVDLKESLKQDNEYIGTDITDAMYSMGGAQGIDFHIQGVRSAWPPEWRESFDYVHQRLTLTVVGRHPISDVVARECELVKPGGWIELVEVDVTKENTSPALEKLYEAIREMFDIVGCGRNFSAGLKRVLEEAGMQDVGDELVEVQVGPLAKTPELGAKGLKLVRLTAEGFARIAEKMPFSSSKEDLQALVGELHEELGSQGGTCHFCAVYGRKPAK